MLQSFGYPENHTKGQQTNKAKHMDMVNPNIVTTTTATTTIYQEFKHHLYHHCNHNNIAGIQCSNPKSGKMHLTLYKHDFLLGENMKNSTPPSTPPPPPNSQTSWGANKQTKNSNNKQTNKQTNNNKRGSQTDNKRNKESRQSWSNDIKQEPYQRRQKVKQNNYRHKQLLPDPHRCSVREHGRGWTTTQLRQKQNKHKQTLSHLQKKKKKKKRKERKKQNNPPPPKKKKTTKPPTKNKHKNNKNSNNNKDDNNSKIKQKQNKPTKKISAVPVSGLSL